MYVYVSIVYMLCSPMLEEIKNVILCQNSNTNCISRNLKIKVHILIQYRNMKVYFTV